MALNSPLPRLPTCGAQYDQGTAEALNVAIEQSLDIIKRAIPEDPMTASDALASVDTGALFSGLQMGNEAPPTGSTVTFLESERNLSDVDSVADARDNLGLGLLATYSPSVSPDTYVLAAFNSDEEVEYLVATQFSRELLDFSTAIEWREHLDVASTGHTHTGVYQPASANLDELAAVNPTAAGLALLDDADAAAQRATLGLGTAATTDASAYATTGHNHAGVYQPASANLDEYAAVNPTSAGLALLDDADAAAQRTTLGLNELASYAISPTATFTTVPGVDSSGVPTVLFFKEAAWLYDLIESGTTADARTALGLGTMATATATDYLAKSGNLSGLSSTATSRTNLGVAIGTDVQAYSVHLANAITAWTPWTPTVGVLSGTFTSATSDCAYKIVGKTLHMRVSITPVGVGMGLLYFGLPPSVTPAVDDQQCLAGRNTSAGSMLVGWASNGTSNVIVSTYAAAAPAASGEMIVLSGTIEIA